MLRILHDPQYLTIWELWYYSVKKPCRIFPASTVGLGMLGLGFSWALDCKIYLALVALLKGTM